MTSRLDSLANKVANALRDDNSQGAVFDMLPAWAAEYEAVHGMEPGTSGGDSLLDHYMRDAALEGDLDDDFPDGMGGGIARLGRCVYEWDDAGFYGARLYPSKLEAEDTVAALT